MRAVVFLGQEDIEVQERPDPIPEEDEVLIRVDACGICSTDLHAYKTGMYPPGLILGHEFAGRVEAVGPGVTEFRPGDRVTANSGIGCGRCFLCLSGRENLCEQCFRLGVTDDGAMAEMVKVPRAGVYRIADGLPLQEACLAEPFSVAWHGLDQSRFRPGDRVIVVGAGPLGVCLLQVLRMAGAGATWMTEINPARAELARYLGADLVLDPRKASPFGVLSDLTNSAMADIAFECAGLPETINQALGLVRRGGQVVVCGICDQAVEMDFLSAITSEINIQTTYYSTAGAFARTLHFLAEGRLRAKPLITSEIPFERVKESFETLLHPRNDQAKVLLRPDL